MLEILRVLFLCCLIVMVAAGASVLYLARDTPSAQTAEKAIDLKVFQRFFEEQNQKSALYDHKNLSPATRHNLASSQYGGVNPYDDDNKFSSSEPFPASEILRPYSDPYEFKGLQLDPTKP